MSLDPAAYLLTFLAVIFSSAVFLGVGQALVGLIKWPDTVNAIGRLSYLPLFALGLFSHSTIFGTTFETIARWSPGGAVATLLAGAMQPAAWSGDTWWAFLVGEGVATVSTLANLSVPGCEPCRFRREMFDD